MLQTALLLLTPGQFYLVWFYLLCCCYLRCCFVKRCKYGCSCRHSGGTTAASLPTSSYTCPRNGKMVLGCFKWCNVSSTQGCPVRSRRPPRQRGAAKLKSWRSLRGQGLVANEGSTQRFGQVSHWGIYSLESGASVSLVMRVSGLRGCHHLATAAILPRMRNPN